jgi:hypothetical protein
VFGGDSRYYYLGEFSTSGNEIAAPYGDSAADYTIELKGKQSNGRIEGNIFREGYASMEARLHWRSDLPTGVA